MHFIQTKSLSIKIQYEYGYIAFYHESSNFLRVSLSDIGYTQGFCYFLPYFSLPIFLVATNNTCQHLLNLGDACTDSLEGNNLLSLGASNKSQSITNGKNVITASNTGEEHLSGIPCERISYAMQDLYHPAVW